MPDYQPKKLSFKENIQTAFWAIKLLYRFAGPKLATVLIAIHVLNYPVIVINWAIEAWILNLAVFAVSSHTIPTQLWYALAAHVLIKGLAKFTPKQSLGGHIINSELSSILSLRWKDALNSAVENLSLQKIQDHKIQSLIRDVRDQIKFYTFLQLLTLILEAPDYLIRLFLGFVIALKLSPYLGLAFIAFAVVQMLYSRYRQTIYIAQVQASREISKFLNYLSQKLIFLDTLIRLKEINLLRFLNNFRNYLHGNLRKINVSISRKLNIGGAISTYIPNVALGIGIILASFKQLIKGTMSIGTFQFYQKTITAGVSSATGLTSHLERITNTLIFLKQARILIELSEKSAKERIHIKVKQDEPLELQVSELWYRYPESKKFALKNINLKIPYGSKIAIVGENGAGKTTLLRLITGHLKPTKGIIKIRCRSCKEVEPLKLDTPTKIRIFGILNQQFETFPFLRVRDVIQLDYLAANEIFPLSTFSKLSSTLAKRVYRKEKVNILREVLKASTQQTSKGLIEATKIVGLYDKILNMPEKFDTILSSTFENGMDLSTGQSQRLNIARLVFYKRPITILDEPTSAIDPMAGFKIVENLLEAFKDRTLIMVSHRYSIIRDFNPIVVVKNGQIIEQGSHQELMKLNGYYAKAFKQELKRMK